MRHLEIKASANQAHCFLFYYSWMQYSNPLISVIKAGNMEIDFTLLLIYYSLHAMKHYEVNLIALQLKYLFLYT